ncbi:MAG: hypothetical protein LLG00_09110 [Planctomycetaceae bacterium]|nr:hypothetical protein [Planctomycetaceae bacterium]
MSAAKKQKSSGMPSLGGPWLVRVALAGLLGAAVIGGVVMAWRWLAPRVLGAPEYGVTAERFEITPPPEWIHSDIRAEVFRDPTLDGSLSLMDDDLAERIYKAFKRHPWVAKVMPVDVHRLKIELAYRRPVCMVEVPGGLLPVDSEATLLPPGDFSPVEAAGYPRLKGVEHGPTAAPGGRWTDAKVLGGAEIAAAIGPAWSALGLQSIVPLAGDPTAAATARPEPIRRTVEPFFALLTRGGTRVLWGYAPGATATGELAAGEKLARLQRYVADHDTLEGRQGKPQELDVRTMRPSM